MKAKFLVLLFSFSLSYLFCQTNEVQPNSIILKIKSDVTRSEDFDFEKKRTGIKELDQFITRNRVILIKHLITGKKKPQILLRIEFSTGVDIEKMIEELKTLPCIEIAEPDHISSITGMQSITPNDTYFYNQWGLYNNGTFGYSTATAGADIDMKNAWSITQGDSNVIVGVIDSGTKLDHPEFSGRIWVNSQEIPNNGIDDDANGYIDDINGWNFVSSNNNPSDNNGHGTNVAGIIGATGNNGIGYAGIDWNCKVMTLKVLGSNNQGWDSDIIQSIYYGVDNGARVLNLSLEGTSYSLTYQEAIDYAINNNVVVVAAMGNNNHDIKHYPAAFNGVIAVGSTSSNDTRSNPYSGGSGGSNYGNHISVCAPGNCIFGLHYIYSANYGYYYSGTSQASPHVAGLASLLIAQDPTRTVDEIRMLIESSAEDGVGLAIEDKPLFDPYYGFGRINAYQALSTTPSNKTLTLSVSGIGSLNLPNGTQSYEYGTLITLKPLQNDEYCLQKWVINGVDYENPANEIRFRMNKNYTIQAIFSLRPIKYVTENGAGLKDGSSWSNAYGNDEFQNGINSSSTGTIFWVAQGTYKPTQILPFAGSENRGKSFKIKENTIIYGGFNGTETMLSQRDYTNNITQFSGDLGVLNNTNDNSYHVVWFETNDKTSFIDGVTIKNGNANTTSYSSCNYGGGVYLGTLKNCIIEYNSASENGGGAYQSDLIHCIVRNNNANYGGGLYQGSSQQSLFTNNSAINGGAIYESDIDSCNIFQNFAIVHGGGAYNSTITNSNIIDNVAIRGGGAYLGNITYSFFEGDSASDGGATYNVTLENCTLSTNISTNYGGAVYSGTIMNSHFENNIANGKGGAIYNGIANNCTFTNNKSYSSGGAGYNTNFNHCIFLRNWGSYGGAISASEADSCSFTANVAEFYGGGGYQSNISNSSFLNDTATVGGGGYQCDLINCSLTGNFASSKSGGLHLGNATNCIFEHNRSLSEGGGAGSEIDATNCIFNNNHTLSSGGALQLSSVNNCTFSFNSAGSGGAMYNCEAMRCTILNNSAINGGGTHSGRCDSCYYIQNRAISNGVGGGAFEGIITNSVFSNDSAFVAGAAFSAELFNCILVNNKAHYNGGAVSSCTVKNSLLYNNTAHNSGGAAYNGKIINSTIVENKSQNSGSGTYSCNLINCMVWGNKKLNGTYDQKWGGTDTNCAIQGTTIPPGPNNIALSSFNQGSQSGINYPVFLDPINGDFRIQPTSAGYNAGNSSYCQSLYTNNNGNIIMSSQVDLNGNPRIIGGNIDIGAFETSSSSLTILPSLNGTTNPISGTYNYNSSYIAIISAFPNTGYHFQKWVVNGSDSLNHVLHLPMNIEHTIQAFFGVNQYELSLNKSGNGSINHPIGTTLYDYNTTINLIAIPDTGNCFVKWICNGFDSLNADIAITIDTTYQIEAIFSDQAELNLSISGNGSINHPIGITHYDIGTELELTATPDAHNQFIKWVVNGQDSLNPTLNLLIDTYYSIEAIFELEKHEFILTIQGNGSVNHTLGETPYHFGSILHLTATPDNDHHFDKWKINGVNNFSNPVQITIQDNTTVEAIFLYNTSVDETYKNLIRIYPNPVDHILWINSSHDDIHKIEIFNELGQLIYTDVCQNTNKYSFNTKELNAGIYFLRIFMNNSNIFHQKFLKF